MEKLIRSLKISIETRINEKLSVRHPRRLKGKHSSQVVVKFGTAVLFSVSGKVQGSTKGARWFHGIFLGKQARTEENIVMRENGSVVRACAIKELQKMLALKDYDVLRGTPHDPIGTLRQVT